MSNDRKKNKEKKAERSRKYAARRKAAASTLPSGYSTPTMQLFGYEHPLHSLADGQINELFYNLGKDAEQKFAKEIVDLSSLIMNHDPLELLATAVFYTQFRGIGPNTDFTQELSYTQFILELLQSFCLRYTEDKFSNTPVLHPCLSPILELLKSCSDNFAKKRFQALQSASEQERKLLPAIEGARLHTQAMRNWGYPQHMREIAIELFENIDEKILRVIGLKATEIFVLMERIQEQVTSRINEFMKMITAALRSRNIHNIVQEFGKLTAISKDEEKQIEQIIKSHSLSKQHAKLFLLSYFHQYLPTIFIFSVDNFMTYLPPERTRQAMQRALDSLSLSFGSLASDNPEHLFMQSKIRTRPFVKIGETEYFIPIPGLLHSFFIEIIELLIMPHANLKELYHKRRAIYLETRMTDLLKIAFPNCPVYAGTLTVDQADGKTYENDCLAVVGPVAIIFEAKSERVNDAARRGGTNTLKNQYKSMVQEPAIQATRFAQLLETGEGTRTFTTTSGEQYTIDLTSIRRAVCVSVVLDWFPAPTMSWRQLTAANLVSNQERPTIHISLADLIVLVEVLADPAIRLHYFWRRSEWEEHVDYLGDEEDLLVYYLSEGLTITKALRDHSAVIHLLGRSDELHRFYMSAWADPERSVPPPRRILSKCWKSLLTRIESNTHQHKWDIACIILDLSFDQQNQFADQFQKTVERVRRNGNDCGENGLSFSGEVTESQGVVVGFAYRQLSRDERNARANDLVEKAIDCFGAKRVVVIGQDVDQRSDAYDFLAYHDTTISNSIHPDPTTASAAPE